jgi:hypothetical protein
MSNKYLTADNVDDLGRMLMALLSEVWIMRDRMAVTEKLLEEKIGLTTADIDDFVPDPEFSQTLEVLRDRVVGTVVSAPIAADDRSVDSILRRAGLQEAADRLKAKAEDKQP